MNYCVSFSVLYVYICYLYFSYLHLFIYLYILFIFNLYLLICTYSLIVVYLFRFVYVFNCLSCGVDDILAFCVYIFGEAGEKAYQITGHIFHVNEIYNLNLNNRTFSFSECLVNGSQRKLSRSWVALCWYKMAKVIFCISRRVKDSMSLIFCDVPYTMTVCTVPFYISLIIDNCDSFDTNENCDIYDCIHVMADCDIFLYFSGCDIICYVIGYIQFIYLLLIFLTYMLFINFKSVIVICSKMFESRNSVVFDQHPPCNVIL